MDTFHTRIIVVEPGTEIEDPKTGEKMAVDDNTAVGLGRDLYVTEATYESLKRHPDVRSR